MNKSDWEKDDSFMVGLIILAIIVAAAIFFCSP